MSSEDWLHQWLKRDPDDAELAQMTLKEVWAIWHYRLDVHGSRWPVVDMITERWQAVRDAEKFRQSFENGDRLALFRMLRRCAETGLRIPGWAADAFIEGHDAVVEFREKGSWDDAFGRPIPKGTHLASEARRRRIRWDMARTLGLANPNGEEWGKIPGLPIDDAFFDILGQEYGVSRTVAKEIYYEHKRYTIMVDEALEAGIRELRETSGNTDD